MPCRRVASSNWRSSRAPSLAALAESGRGDHRAAHAFLAALGEHFGRHRRRRQQEREVDRPRQVAHARVAALAVERRVTRIDQVHGSLEAAVAQVATGDVAERAGYVARADDRHGRRAQHGGDASRGHGPRQCTLRDQGSTYMLSRCLADHCGRPQPETLMAVAFVTHPHCRLHDMGDDHPEQPARLGAIEDELHVRGLYDLLLHHDAPRAGVEHLLRVHPLHYIEDAREPFAGRGTRARRSRHLDVPRHVRGRAARRRRQRARDRPRAERRRVTARSATCGRPGHHAERATTMGFCFFNNVAVAARHALDHHGLERVAVLDFDVHLGNGTEDIFSDDERVLLCSSYQYPLWPDLNPPTVPGRIVNCPLPPGSGSDAFRSAVTEHWVPALDAFRPQLLLISAGFDAHAADDMAGPATRRRATTAGSPTSRVRSPHAMPAVASSPRSKAATTCPRSRRAPPPTSSGCHAESSTVTAERAGEGEPCPRAGQREPQRLRDDQREPPQSVAGCRRPRVRRSHTTSATMNRSASPM